MVNLIDCCTKYKYIKLNFGVIDIFTSTFGLITILMLILVLAIKSEFEDCEIHLNYMGQKQNKV